MFEVAEDQATGLREIFEAPALTVLPLVAARHGTGLRALVVNIATAFARTGQRTVIIDAGPAATANALGLRVPLDLSDLLTGRAEFADVVVASKDGPWVLKATRGIPEFLNTSGDPTELYLGFRRLDAPFDVAILAGHVVEIATMTRNDDELVFIASGESECLTATYAEIKRAHSEHGQMAFRVLINRVDSDLEGIAAFRRLAQTARKFLGVSIEFGGSVLRDAAYAAADRAQSSIFRIAPASDAARHMTQLVQSMQAWRLGRYTLNQSD